MVTLSNPTPSGRTEIPVDACLAPVVQALNDVGIATVASCCGHGKFPGSIVLADGREWVLAASMAEAESYRRFRLAGGADHD